MRPRELSNQRDWNGYSWGSGVNTGLTSMLITHLGESPTIIGPKGDTTKIAPSMRRHIPHMSRRPRKQRPNPNFHNLIRDFANLIDNHCPDRPAINGCMLPDLRATFGCRL